MCSDEKAVTQWGGKAYQLPIVEGGCQQLPLWCSRSFYAFLCFWYFLEGDRWRSYEIELMVKNLLNTTSVLYYLIMWSFEKQLYNNNMYKRNCTVFQQHRYASRILRRTWSISEEWDFPTSVHSKSIYSINILSV